MVLEQLKALIQSGVDSGAFPGATFCITTKNKKYMDFVGLKAKFPKEEANALDTIYDMASVTKVVTTTTCLLKLLEQGKIRLFDRVNLYVPRFKYDDIYIFHLVTHTSGLIEYLKNQKDLKSREEALDLLFEQPKIFETGTDLVYSDLNYILLGLVIESITGMSLDKFAEESVYKPLEMKDTCFNPKNAERCAPTEERNDQVVQGMVRGKVHDETSYILGGVAGHAGMFSTIEDMSHFMQMILNEGKFNGKQFLSPITVDTLFHPLVEKPVGLSTYKLYRSIGWIVRDYNASSGDFTSRETIEHTGFTGTNVWIDRLNGIAFCMLSNRVHPTRKNILHIALRAKIANFIMTHLDEIKEELENVN